VLERDPRPVGLDVVHRHLLDLEEQRLAVVEADPDQVLHDLGLAVDHDGGTAGQVAQRHAVALAVELEADAVMDDPLTEEPLAGARPDERVDGALLEDAGPDPVLDMVAASRLEHHRLDALGAQELGEGQAGGPGSHDADLGAQPRLTPPRCPSPTGRWRMPSSPPGRRSRWRSGAAPP
jgi:hypothetical protein